MESVRAEMVAGVLAVVVAEGDVVGAGQTLLLLESMKMEIPVVPEGHGRVVRVAVTVGDVVQEGDLLVVLEPVPRAPTGDRGAQGAPAPGR